jgi:VanZ family protein
VVLSVAAIVGVPLLIIVIELPSYNRMLRELQNSGHAIIFGLFALGWLNLMSAWAGRWIPRRSRQYLSALAAATAVGLVLELAQVIGARDASVSDWLLDIVGALAFLGLVAPFDQRLMSELKWRIPLKSVSIVYGLLLLAGAFVPPTAWFLTYYFRDQALPTLASFESAWERRLIVTERASVEFVAPPARFSPVDGKKVARLRLFPALYPGLEIWEPSPDWSGYKRLRFSVLSEYESDLRLAVRIQDLAHNQLYEDRFNRAFDLHPGMNELEIDLADVKSAPAGREMDMSRITSLIIFTGRPQDTLTIYLDNIRLE